MIPMMLVATLLSWFLVGLFIHISKERGWGQTVRADGPESHLKKSGTPTAGGVPFVVALLMVFVPLYFTGHAGGVRELLMVLVAVAMGLIGGADDWFKIRSRMTGKGRKELKAREKFPLQILVALSFACFAAPLASHTLFPALGGIGGFPLWDVLLLTFVMVASVNAFNFTDGLDGLLAGVAAIALLPLVILSPSAALMVAVLVGYLWFNAHPARVFMGDMGSHAIGALVAAGYILYADVWLLPVAGFIPVIEALSVMIQVPYFRKTGKRIFRMTPIHHHFERLDTPWPETHITMRFWVITAMMTSLAWWLMGGRP